ncbi:FadR/GntR family transcriptional regulator [Nocardia sp. BMG51109]|uniref:FadR/GntR family transcriptional regulator n=1 Tax=Nocardia sp. BMG51109 TaxID=1056816 RepID=UPI000463BF4C|nr:FadR/GntR family transcriptional regulator [Nocardia sp. BMG51109]
MTSAVDAGPESTDAGPEFTTVKLGRMSRTVVEQFQEQMRNGRLRAGHKLPPERELATAFGVGRNTMREALRELDLLGMVQSRHGEGTFVTDPSAAELVAPFRAVVEFSSTASDSVMEFRRAFEPGVSALAARNLTEEGRQRLYEALAEFEARVAAGDSEIQRADADFHLMIGHATGNPTVIGIHSAVYSLLRGFRDRLDGSSYQPTSCQVAGHRRIYDAIVTRDADAAAREMTRHLEEVWTPGEHDC